MNRLPMQIVPSPFHMRFISSQTAKLIDQLLLKDYKYDILQLIEAAGSSIFHKLRSHLDKEGSILVVCGPGNNGGDGLVLLRYLHIAGYRASGLIPWTLKKDHLIRLQEQCAAMCIPLTQDESIVKDAHDYIVDAVFGFGFRKPLEDKAAELLVSIQEHGRQIICVDIPSGWDVDEPGFREDYILKPDILISMTAPKICAQAFRGSNHLIVDDFVPKQFC